MASRKKIAAVITEYRIPAHADVIVGKFIKGFPTDDGLIEPQVDIVSMYLDQIPENDIGLQVSKEYDIPIYQSISAALCLGGSELAVDGVLSIGEHGSYAYNEKGTTSVPAALLLRADLWRVLDLGQLGAGVQRQVSVLQLARFQVDVRPRPAARCPLHGRLFHSLGLA